MPSDFPAAFGALKAIMARHAAGLPVLHDTAKNYTVLTPAIGPNGKPIWFGAVMVGKSAVSYHLFPLYFNPKLQAKVSPELLKRKQGKTCFNFQRPDEELFAQLDALTAEAAEHFRRAGYLEAGPISKEKMEAGLRAAGEDPKKIAARRKKVVAAANAKRKATLARARKKS